MLFVDSADKATRFIWLCDAFNVPLVYLADVPGFMIGKDVERQGIIRHGAKMVSAVAEATVPQVCVVLRKAYGAGLYAMGGPGFGPDATLALPTARIAVMGPEAAVNAVYANKIAALDDEGEREAFVAQRRAEYEADVDLLRLAADLVVDAVVQPAQACANRSSCAWATRRAVPASSPRDGTACPPYDGPRDAGGSAAGDRARGRERRRGGCRAPGADPTSGAGRPGPLASATSRGPGRDTAPRSPGCLSSPTCVVPPPTWATGGTCRSSRQCRRRTRSCARRPMAGADEGTAVVADEQTAGRGRLDRSWAAPPGTALLMSWVWRPTGVPAGTWGWLPLLAGVAVSDAVQQTTGVPIALKWPNDLLAETVGPGGRSGKVAGVLAERVETRAGPVAVVGVGVNVDQRAEQLPVDSATSLRLAGAGQVSRADLLSDVLDGPDRALPRVGGSGR